MISVAAFYQFAPLRSPHHHIRLLRCFCQERGIKGTILLAEEGVNGTVAGPHDAVMALTAYVQERLALPKPLEVKFSTCLEMPFFRMKVKLKREIVTMGVPGVEPHRQTGECLDPQAWNDVLRNPQTFVLDTRNDYEVAIGSFPGAEQPHTQNFRDFPAYVARELTDKTQPIAMFCTGGIRCEKASAYLLQQGFQKIYQLRGGILKYLETATENLWRGECFVFDNRVAVNDVLAPGHYQQCHGCRHPLAPEDCESPHYQPGVQCPHCVGKRTTQQLQRAAERHKQVTLAKARATHHIGVTPARQSYSIEGERS